MFRAILNISWKAYPTNISHYRLIPPLTRTIRIRITCFVGHCYQNEEEIIKMFCCGRRTMEQ